jgi:CRISP-associated protein Cas1
VLEKVGQSSAHLTRLTQKVRSGDTSNIEAQAARRYWGLLLGNEFRRDQNGTGLNILLNYGYTVFRAATARSVIAAGLHPTLGLHHLNQGNPMRLVDDLIEPFRPLVDLTVWQLIQKGSKQLTPDTKASQVQTLYQDRGTSLGRTPTIVCMQRLATSLVQVYLRERETIELPSPDTYHNL